MKTTTITIPTPSSALSWAFLLSTIFPSTITTTTATSTTATSKRGYAYLGDTHTTDDALLYSANSSLAWYYNWSPNPVSTAPASSSLPFVPLLHGLADANSSSALATLNALPSTSTHLLTFNEPDGTTASGGSAISPSDAAQSYMDNIVPLRTSSSSREWLISHPATTGSEAGLAWLQEFNASCWEIDTANGCPLDFVALHWYGDFAGLASWLGTLYEFYVTNGTATESQNLTFWITEMALPQQSADETLAMMNQSLNYLDGLSYVEAYAWYGADRKSSSWDGYTGGNVALFTSGGELTNVGALYLGGEKEGFKAGMTGGAGPGVRVSWVAAVLATAMFALNMS